MKRPAKKITPIKKKEPVELKFGGYTGTFDWGRGTNTFMGSIDTDSNLQIAIKMLRDKHPNLRVKIMTAITPNGYIQVVFEGITTLRLPDTFMMGASVVDLVNEFEKAITYKPIEKTVGIGGKRGPIDDWTDKWLKENS